MTAAREDVLGRIRTALGAEPRVIEIPRDYVVASSLQRDGQVERFAERAAEYRATVWRCSEADVAAAVGAALAEHGARRLVAPSDLPADWRPEGIEWLEDGQGLGVEELDASDGVVTGCAMAIADTGTIVMDAGERQGRRALTLLPDLHVCVVRSSQVVGHRARGDPQAGRGRPDRPAPRDLHLRTVRHVGHRAEPRRGRARAAAPRDRARLALRVRGKV